MIIYLKIGCFSYPARLSPHPSFLPLFLLACPSICPTDSGCNISSGRRVGTHVNIYFPATRSSTQIHQLKSFVVLILISHSFTLSPCLSDVCRSARGHCASGEHHRERDNGLSPVLRIRCESRLAGVGQVAEKRQIHPCRQGRAAGGWEFGADCVARQECLPSRYRRLHVRTGQRHRQ